MVLLIFFLIGASFNLLTEGMLQTELDPRTGPGAGVSVEILPRIRIELRNADEGRSAEIRVGEHSIRAGDFEGLYDYLRQRRDAGADASNPVVVAPDGPVRWDFVMQAMDATIRAGFANVQFSIQVDPQG